MTVFVLFGNVKGGQWIMGIYGTYEAAHEAQATMKDRAAGKQDLYGPLWYTVEEWTVES